MFMHKLRPLTRNKESFWKSFFHDKNENTFGNLVVGFVMGKFSYNFLNFIWFANILLPKWIMMLLGFFIEIRSTKRWFRVNFSSSSFVTR